MKVKYVPPPADNQSNWLKESMEYVVLELLINKAGAFYRILTENSAGPTLHSSNVFEIVSDKIPSSWVVTAGYAEAFYLIMSPAKWSITGFWEDYFDNKSDA